MNIKYEVENLKTELISLRRDFHKYPELGFEEYRTSEIIANYLEECGLEVKRNIAKTGVLGLIRGSQPGPTILLRSDMDALPVLEENDLPFKSINEGIMHACGHDGHMSMLLIAAKILSKNREEIKGNIKFAFQPNEEDAGAKIMIGEGILEDPKVDAALGIHLWSPIETGKIGIVPGPIMASSYYFKLVIHGKGGHGGAPHTAIDPISCAINIMQTAQTMQTKELDALEPTIITFCKINSGTSPIIIPEKVEIEGSLRCLHDGTEEVQKRFEQIIKSICEAHRTTYELEFKCGNILLSNDPKMTELVKRAGEEVVKKENVLDSKISVMLGEDFAEFCVRVPSAFYFVGVADKEKGTDYPHHHPRFNIDEDALPIGVEMHIRGALEYLNTRKS